MALSAQTLLHAPVGLFVFVFVFYFWQNPVEAPHPFSTGHANSPCTITVGRAQLQKLSVPARPHRIFDHLVLGQKAGLPEDLSGEEVVV